LPLARAARKTTLITFFNQHNSRYPDVNQKRINDIKNTVALTDDSGVIEPNRIMIEVLVPQLKLLIESVMRMDIEIKKYYKNQDDRIIFDSFPGAGPQLAPRIFVAFGANRDKYNTAAEIQKYTGVAPVIEQSGQKTWTHWRYSCPTFLSKPLWNGRGNLYAIPFGQKRIMISR